MCLGAHMDPSTAVETVTLARLVLEVEATLPRVDMARKAENIGKNMKPFNLTVPPVQASLNTEITR